MPSSPASPRSALHTPHFPDPTPAIAYAARQPAPDAAIPHSDNPQSSIYNLQSISQADALATRCEQQLAAWFDAAPLPAPIDQINAASQVIWRITAVRKTLIILTDPKLRPRRREEFDEAFRELNRHMDTMERYLDTLTPAPAPKPAPDAPSPDNPQSSISNPQSPTPSPRSALRTPHFTLRPIVLPAFDPAPPSARSAVECGSHAAALDPQPAAPSPDTPHSDNPQSTIINPQSPTPTPHSAFRIPHSTPCCPTLRNPLATAQAASHQVGALCAASGLPTPSPDNPQSTSPRSALRTPHSPSPPPDSAPPAPTHDAAPRASATNSNLQSSIDNLKSPTPNPDP